MKKLFFLTIVFLLAFSSCKKDNVVPETTVTPAMARDSLYYIMKEFYFWYNEPEASSITETNKGNYATPSDLLEAMRYKARDRWSFVADYNEFIAQMNGDFVGHGIRMGLDSEGKARIAMIYNNSPLYANGVRRGWIVKTINGTEVAPVLLSNDLTAYTNLIGPGKAGITNIFVFVNAQGNEVTIQSTKSAFTLNTVITKDTLQLTTGTTGHLVFDQFITPSADELASAFSYFKSVGVSDLILDLRYNTGGYLAIAQALASYIAGDAQVGKVFAKLSYNDKHQDANSSFLFTTTSYSLNLPRLVVITTRSTASASEAVINGLRPFVNIVTIGDTTNGKPTGMNGWPVGKKYFFWPVTFKIVNASNEGDYFDGIFPAKVLSDDITHDFSDRNELCLKEAIHYLETGSISTTKSAYLFKRQPNFSERPAWMNNAFVEEKK
jgi:C-terminal processing protease CtpA/Prc